MTFASFERFSAAQKATSPVPVAKSNAASWDPFGSLGSIFLRHRLCKPAERMEFIASYLPAIASNIWKESCFLIGKLMHTDFLNIIDPALYKPFNSAHSTEKTSCVEITQGPVYKGSMQFCRPEPRLS